MPAFALVATASAYSGQASCILEQAELAGSSSSSLQV